ncbi:MAG: class I SAM-dependent methyltransferase [Saprospiraceae bacterium]|nr:class I SAM-dependent methyltransferase [Saprospiraceae bacterium]
MPDTGLSKLVYDILEKKSGNLVFQQIENIRNDLMKDNSVIDFNEMGAGKNGLGRKLVSEIAKSSLSPAWKCNILYNTTIQANPGFILELGTSLGISALYLAASDNGTVVHTVEGNKSVAQIAEKNFQHLGMSNIIQYIGEFDEVLNNILAKNPRIEIVYLDGNHNMDATLGYFNKILTHCTDETIFIIDDIHWSAGMNSAWNEICNHKRVSCILDLFQFGIALLDKRYSGHFKIIKKRYKPF